MAERREFAGSVVITTLTGPLNSLSSFFSVVDGSTFPTGNSGNPFVVVLSRGEANEEKVLISSRNVNMFTIAQRGYDGTFANSHNSGGSVDHVLDAVAIQDMNTTTFDNEINIWMAV